MDNIEIYAWILLLILLILSILNFYFHTYRNKKVSNFYHDLNERIKNHNIEVIKNFESSNNLIIYEDEVFRKGINYEKIVYSFKKIKPENILNKSTYKKLYDKN